MRAISTRSLRPFLRQTRITRPRTGTAALRRLLLQPILAAFALLVVWASFAETDAAERSRFASSDSNSGYMHHIDLYDTANRKITAESTTPYSPLNTCGRCHDYEAISHGWHFNAFSEFGKQGRQSEPWIWTDVRTGTQLPLSYRPQDESRRGVFDPREIGLSTLDMTRQFASRFPGGGFAKEETPRTPLTGALEIDCMVCHATASTYDFEERRSHIADENFAWAPTAALRLGTVDGRVSRVKEGADPADEKTIAMLPKVAYNPARFASDGKVFFDLKREPENNACYQCHSTRTVTAEGIEPRWIHDEDVHLRAGMACVDCHRNGIDHHTVRGYVGEEHPSGVSVTTLSCTGCHLGDESSLAESPSQPTQLAGRLGSPRPMHVGLPPVHFQKLSCTACHSGPVPREEALGAMTSLAHGLGSKEHRTGREMPMLQSPVFAKLDDGRIYPQRAMWPSYWGVRDGDRITPISPVQAYETTRKTLRVRRDFIEEVLTADAGPKELKQWLGDEAAALDPAEWTPEQTELVRSEREKLEQAQFDTKIADSLEAIEKGMNVEQAVFVATGRVYARRKVAGDSESTGKTESRLEVIETRDDATSQMVTWPLSHNVRPAGWSLGVTGCIECHADGGMIFDSTVTPRGPTPGTETPIAMASIQGIDANQRLMWNQLFGGRANFKFVIGASLVTLVAVLLIGVGAAGASLRRRTLVAVNNVEVPS